MQARHRLESASLGPDALKAVGQAFDEAWATVASQFTDPDQTEAARLKLAEAILSVATDDSRDVAILKRAGLDALGRSASGDGQ
jgi:hypothetical protein